MTSASLDSPDWVGQQAPVTRDTPVYAGTAIPGGTFVNNIDVGKFQSLTITVGPDTGTLGNWCELDIDSYYNGNFGFERAISFPARTNGNSPSSTMLWRVPLDGDNLNISFLTNDPGGLDVNINGSLRQVPTPELVVAGQGVGPLLLADSIVAPANGSSTQFYVPPTQNGYLFMYSIPTTNNIQFRVQGTAYKAGAFQTDYVYIGQSTNGLNQDGVIQLANTGTTWFIDNFTATAETCSIRVWPLA